MNTSKGNTAHLASADGNGPVLRRLRKGMLSALAFGLSLLALPDAVQAQEIPLTGPLAGAPAVRKLRLYRQSRFEVAPAISFTLLDEFQRTILLGGRLTFNLTEWLGIGAWGAYGGLIRYPTSLTDHIQEVNEGRRERAAADGVNYGDTVTGRLTKVNLGADLKDQVALIDWVVAPQLTLVPFRGKIAIFQSIYADTDVYVFGGPAFIGLKERKDCANCENDQIERVSRMAIAPTFGLGLTFYVNKWSALGVEWRAVPFAWNRGGFDTAGSGKDNAFPDDSISSDDRQFRFNQFVTVSYNFYLPTQYRVGE